MKESIIETVIGFIVICVAIFSFMFFYKISDSKKDEESYFLNASFQNIDGLVEGNDVKLSGIKIGYIDNLTLENDTYFALARLKIKKGISIPSDSKAIVSTTGLIGSKYIRINPGTADDNLQENGKIKFTQSSINIEDLISKLVYPLTNK